MTQKLNVSSAVEFDRFIFSVSEFEVPGGQKKKQENGTKAKNVPGYREISVFWLIFCLFFQQALADQVLIRGTFGKT